jgi:hypothetical protein
LRSLSAALEEEDHSLRRSASLSAIANVGKRTLVREVSMPRSLRTLCQERARDEGQRPAVVVEKLRVAKGGGVTLVEGAPVKWKKSRADMPTRPCSGQGDAFGASVSSLFIDTSPTKANRR